MNGAKLWPIAIAAVLGTTVAANVALYVAAHEGGANLAEPDYYRRAVVWDSTLAEARRSAELGWRLEAHLAAASPETATLEIEAHDRAGRPIEGASATITALHSRPPMQIVESRASLDSRGTARIRMPLGRRGLWELRLRIRRGGDTFIADLRRELEAPR